MKKNTLKAMFLFSKKAKPIDNILVVVTWIILAVIIFCLIELYSIYSNYKVAEDDRQSIVDAVVSQVVLDDDTSNSSENDNSSEESDDDVTETVIKTIDFDALKEINEDSVAWITIDGSVIDYPVVQSSDNSEYLSTNFYGEYHSLGTIFADYRANPSGDSASDNITLYGHNAKDGSFFAGIQKYKDMSYYEENKFITYYTPENENGDIYVIVALFVANADEEYGEVFHYNDFVNASSEEDFNWFKSEVDARNYIQSDVDFVYGDKLLSLSTCDYTLEEGRCVVVARKLRDGETVDDF